MGHCITCCQSDLSGAGGGAWSGHSLPGTREGYKDLARAVQGRQLALGGAGAAGWDGGTCGDMSGCSRWVRIFLEAWLLDLAETTEKKGHLR